MMYYLDRMEILSWLSTWIGQQVILLRSVPACDSVTAVLLFSDICLQFDKY